MSAIGGPGGIGGPKGPGGPDSPDNVEAEDGVDQPHATSEATTLSRLDAPAAGAAAAPTGAASATSDIDRLATDLRAGRLTPREAMDRLVAQMADTDTLPPADRAELRELMNDLLGNDPHLAALVGRLG